MSGLVDALRQKHKQQQKEKHHRWETEAWEEEQEQEQEEREKNAKVQLPQWHLKEEENKKMSEQQYIQENHHHHHHHHQLEEREERRHSTLGGIMAVNNKLPGVQQWKGERQAGERTKDAKKSLVCGASTAAAIGKSCFRAPSKSLEKLAVAAPAAAAVLMLVGIAVVFGVATTAATVGEVGLSIPVLVEAGTTFTHPRPPRLAR